LGKQLAIEHPMRVDVVIPVPDSAVSAAEGYAKQAHLPLEIGIVKNRYIHRTFIRPAQRLREQDVEMKFNPIRELITGRRIALIDDSLVRGTTIKRLVQRLRAIGVKEVHFLLSSPPVLYPDFYGIDTPDQTKLIASQVSLEEIRRFIGVDSLHFLSYEGMVKAIGVPEVSLCTSCFTGRYPVDIGERAKGVKQVVWRK
jgi:amidophosphoribosyltransferase